MYSEVLDDIDGHIFRDVGGYFEKYFGAPKPSKLAIRTTPGWLVNNPTNFVYDSSRALKSWLDSIASLHGAQWQQMTSTGTGLRVLKLTRTNDQAEVDSPQHVRALAVVTDQKQALYRTGFAELCKAAGMIFDEDPLRLFIHALIAWGTIIELWTIDRSGLYSCKPFDILNDSTRFIHVISRYALAEVIDLGVNPVHQLIDNGSMLLDSETHRLNGVQPIELSGETCTFNGDGLIMDQGLAIYFSNPIASGPQVVVKYKWRRVFEDPEGNIFKSMGQVSPRGVVSLYYAEDIESTSALRAGLQFGTAVKVAPDDTVLQTTGCSSELPSIFTERHPDRMGDEAYVERIWSCTAIFPKGQEMRAYQTPLQVIEAFHDALGGLRDLYQKCKILHRDVSVYNILLTNPLAQSNEETPPKGFLIDLEGALDLKNPPKRNQTIGTTIFMAIGLLRGKLPHTYRYDLESLFYSLIWFCVQPRATNICPPDGSRLWRWRGPDEEQLAENKLQDMTPECFQMILDEFDPDFYQYRGLADGIRKLLFPVQPDGSLNIKTDTSENGTDVLYDGIMREFKAVIAQQVD